MTISLSRPLRIQLKRVKGWRMPPNTIKVDRTTVWGNPFRPGHECVFLPGRKVSDNRHAASLYLGFAPDQKKLVAAAKKILRGANLACWCKLCDLHTDGKPAGEDCPWCEPCHVDTLIKIANDD